MVLRILLASAAVLVTVSGGAFAQGQNKMTITIVDLQKAQSEVRQLPTPLRYQAQMTLDQISSQLSSKEGDRGVGSFNRLMRVINQHKAEATATALK